MNTPPRLSLRALVCGLGVSAGGELFAAENQATEEPRPGIFAPRPASAPAAPPPGLARSRANSEKVAAQVRERVLAKASAFDVAALPLTPRPLGEETKVLMEKFVVKAVKVKSTAVEAVESPLVRFLQSGTWFRSPDGKYQGDLKLVPAAPIGALPREPVMRVELTLQKNSNDHLRDQGVPDKGPRFLGMRAIDRERRLSFISPPCLSRSSSSLPAWVPATAGSSRSIPSGPPARPSWIMRCSTRCALGSRGWYS